MNDNLHCFIELISKGAVKYTDPRKLKISVVDKKIRKSIKNINSSNKVWTLWSCQGHHDKTETTLPYVTFVVDNLFVKDFFNLIFISLPKYKNKQFPVTPNHYLTVNRGFSNKYYTIISIHWSSSFVNKNKFYSDLLTISKKIRNF